MKRLLPVGSKPVSIQRQGIAHFGSCVSVLCVPPRVAPPGTCWHHNLSCASLELLTRKATLTNETWPSRHKLSSTRQPRRPSPRRPGVRANTSSRRHVSQV